MSINSKNPLSAPRFGNQKARSSLFGFSHSTSLIKVLFGLLFIGVIAAYTIIQSEDFVDGPQITILSPESGILFEEPLVHIQGKAERVADITLNGNPIFIDESGNFDEQLLLVDGLNIITLEAQDRFERTVSKELELIYK